QQRLDERRLARAVAAQQTGNLAPLDAQANAFERRLPLAAQPALDIRLRQIARFNRRLIDHEFLPRQTTAPEQPARICQRSLPRADGRGFRHSATPTLAIGRRKPPNKLNWPGDIRPAVTCSELRGSILASQMDPHRTLASSSQRERQT